MTKRMRTGALIAEAMATYSRDFEKVDETLARDVYRRAPRSGITPPEWYFRIVSIRSSQKWRYFEVHFHTSSEDVKMHLHHAKRSNAGDRPISRIDHMNPRRRECRRIIEENRPIKA